MKTVQNLYTLAACFLFLHINLYLAPTDMNRAEKIMMMTITNVLGSMVLFSSFINLIQLAVEDAKIIDNHHHSTHSNRRCNNNNNKKNEKIGDDFELGGELRHLFGRSNSDSAVEAPRLNLLFRVEVCKREEAVDVLDEGRSLTRLFRKRCKFMRIAVRLFGKPRRF